MPNRRKHQLDKNDSTVRKSFFNNYPVGDKIYSAKGDPTEWTFLHYYPGSKGRIRTVLCKCSCGNEATVTVTNLRNGKSKRCMQCASKLRSENHPKLKLKQSSYNQLFHAYRKNAEKRGYEFELTREYFIILTLQNCFYCGKPPEQEYCLYKPGTRELRNNPIMYNGIDRLENSKGYTVGNSVPCCGRCNRMKMDDDVDVFLKRLYKIVTFIGNNDRITELIAGKSLEFFKLNRGDEISSNVNVEN